MKELASKGKKKYTKLQAFREKARKLEVPQEYL